MTATHESGPIVTYGFVPSSGAATSAQNSNPEAGPGATYQGDCLMDVRFPYNPGSAPGGQFANSYSKPRGLLNYPYLCAVDAVPVALSATLIAAAATPVTSTPMTLQSTNTSGRAVSIPVVPQGSSITAANVVQTICLDPGHTIGTTGAGSNSVTSVGDTGLLGLGNWILIVGAGTGGTNLSTQIIGKTATTLTIFPAAVTIASGTPILLLDAQGVSAWPWLASTGAVGVFDPYSALSRGIRITSSNAGDNGATVTIRGYDVYLFPLTEVITVVGGGTADSLKAFKYVVSATPFKGSAWSGTLSIGTTDNFGLSYRTEFWEYVNLFYNGAFVSASTGWTAGLTAGTAATGTNADVRGTYTVQSASNGSKRLAVFSSIPARQLLSATWNDPSRLFGQTQFAG